MDLPRPNGQHYTKPPTIVLEFHPEGPTIALLNGATPDHASIGADWLQEYALMAIRSHLKGQVEATEGRRVEVARTMPGR